MQADPDAPVALQLGGTRIVPGECAAAPEGARGGRIRVEVEDGRHDTSRRRRVWVRRRGTVTLEVSLSEGKQPAVKVRRARCDPDAAE